MADITKQDVTDFINSNYENLLTADDVAKVDGMLTPELAEVLIKVVGNVTFLTHVRDNGSN